MTGNTRDYLADLANKKGVKLPGMQEASQAEASALIDELKTKPDQTFRALDKADLAEVKAMIANVNKELAKWTFER